MNIKRTYQRIRTIIFKQFYYCTVGVWNDTRRTYPVDFIKTINLFITSFLDKNLQQKASSLTFNTLLAIVPALALLFAIARGFGFQKLIESELFKYLPAQKDALEKGIIFVESYLEQSSQGIFLGIGIVFLLWTLISLTLNVEDIFNHIWSVKQGRPYYRKITDYTAMFLIFPILIICEGGLSIFMATISSDTIFSPLMMWILDILPIILTWLIFAATFYLIPYTKVRFKYALISGILSGTAFHILQWLFVAGQIYVSKYNAIYGSFAFVPLFLIWLHFTWLITLGGVGLTFSAQNIFSFNYKSKIENISNKYKLNITIVLTNLIVKRFENQEKAYSYTELANLTLVPIQLIKNIIDRLIRTKILVAIDSENECSIMDKRFQPAFDINKLSIGILIEKLNSNGNCQFLNNFDCNYNELINEIENINDIAHEHLKDKLIKDL